MLNFAYFWPTHCNPLGFILYDSQLPDFSTGGNLAELGANTISLCSAIFTLTTLNFSTCFAADACVLRSQSCTASCPACVKHDPPCPYPLPLLNSSPCNFRSHGLHKRLKRTSGSSHATMTAIKSFGVYATTASGTPAIRGTQCYPLLTTAELNSLSNLRLRL